MEYLTNNTDLKKVADAIREKGGTSAALQYPDGFVTAISNIQTGSGGVDVRLNAITPDRYQYDEAANSISLNLGGLITGKFFVCVLWFDGTSISGTPDQYAITISHPVEPDPEYNHNFVVCAGPTGSGYIPTLLKSGENNVYDLSMLIEAMSNLSQDAPADIDVVKDSYIVSWN